MGTRPSRGEVRSLDEHERLALERDYRAHADWLRTAARGRLGNSHAADDLVQEAFVRAARYPAERRIAPRFLLLRILGNLIKDSFRSNGRERTASAALFDLPSHDRYVAADQEQQLALKQILLSMPPPLRDVFLLARFTPLTQPQIAARLRISVKTVEWRLARALEYCAAQLGE